MSASKQSGSKHSTDGATTLRETLTSLAIAFTMAFLFRGFVLEAFLIPTGSMSPTLLGQHMRFRGENTGSEWTVGPWYYNDPARQLARNPQAPTLGRDPKLQVRDPHTGPAPEQIPLRDFRSGLDVRPADPPKLLAGDRIFVLKYIPGFFAPTRYDVFVFKNPTQPWENYIKRLLGLPGEQVAIVDGDVFSRAGDLASDPETITDDWSGEGWSIRRKPDEIQQRVWWVVSDTYYKPRSDMRGYIDPWIKSDGWNDGDGSLTLDAQTGGAIRWDQQAWPITDYLGYNENPLFISREDGATRAGYPMGDVRISMALDIGASSQIVTPLVRVRGHEFAARIDTDSVELRVTPLDAAGVPITDATQTLETATLPRPLEPGVSRRIEFWHVDQSLSLWIDGERVARAEYEWDPANRILMSTGSSITALLEREDAETVFADPTTYASRGGAEPRIEFSAGGAIVHRLSLSRDLHYQAAVYRQPGHPRLGAPALATHPWSSPVLGADQFMACGDNSAASLDSRLWDASDPWVRDAMPHAEMGLVPREMVIGKAFFVYFPALQTRFGIPVPDVGRMRFIR